MKTMIINNANIVLADEQIKGSLKVQDGVIEDISETPIQHPAAIDFEGQYCMPGLIELHTDNLEKHFSPRPKVTWPGQPAVVAHDSQLVAAGITTVFDAIALGDVNEGSQRLENLHAMLNAIKQAQNHDVLRAQHFLHLRCEVSHGKALDLFEQLIHNPMVSLVSVMDHSPGQRQFTSMDAYKTYYQGKYHLNNDEMEAFIVKQKENSRLYSDSNRKQIVAICQESAIAMASHDDATPEHVEESANFGMTLAEFPTTEIAASLSHEKGMGVMMGAPNVVRGGSHSGNIAAHKLAEKDVLDILSSDYCPASILHAAFKLSELENDYDLSKSINTVSLNPAKTVGLNDRGQIAIGKRADLLQVNVVNSMPIVNKVWAEGERVF